MSHNEAVVSCNPVWPEPRARVALAHATAAVQVMRVGVPSVLAALVRRQDAQLSRRERGRERSREVERSRGREREVEVERSRSRERASERGRETDTPLKLPSSFGLFLQTKSV